MARLLIVHHTPSPAMQELLAAVREGASQVDVVIAAEPALSATAADVLAADGVVLGTPANIGYMSGALKHFFDTVYYPVLEAARGMPFGLYVHGNNDTNGAARAVDAITTGLGWRQVRPPVTIVAPPRAEDVEQCRDLGGLVAFEAQQRAADG